MIVALHGDQLVAGEVLGGHVPGVFRPAGAPADLQSAALSQRVEREAAVPAQHLAVLRDDVARRRRDVARQEFAERAFADETDPGAVGLVEHGQAGGARQGPYLRLAQLTERK